MYKFKGDQAEIDAVREYYIARYIEKNTTMTYAQYKKDYQYKINRSLGRTVQPRRLPRPKGSVDKQIKKGIRTYILNNPQYATQTDIVKAKKYL